MQGLAKKRGQEEFKLGAARGLKGVTNRAEF